MAKWTSVSRSSFIVYYTYIVAFMHSNFMARSFFSLLLPVFYHIFFLGFFASFVYTQKKKILFLYKHIYSIQSFSAMGIYFIIYAIWRRNSLQIKNVVRECLRRRKKNAEKERKKEKSHILFICPVQCPHSISAASWIQWNEKRNVNSNFVWILNTRTASTVISCLHHYFMEHQMFIRNYQPNPQMFSFVVSDYLFIFFVVVVHCPSSNSFAIVLST